MALLELDAARAQLASTLQPLTRVETLPLAEALGRVLKEDLVATAPLPPFDYSAMDGYALTAAAVEVDGAIPVRGECRPGTSPGPLEPGAAQRIFTGALIPPGADTVVMQEDVRHEGDAIFLGQPLRVGANIRRCGEDLAPGSRALTAGTRLRAGHLGLIAALDLACVRVAARPRVWLVTTGNELREPGTPNRPGSVVNTNAELLRAAATSLGAELSGHSHLLDNLETTSATLAELADSADVIVTVGGASVGDHDLIRPALLRAGFTLDFWKLAIKPGKPLLMGHRLSTGPGVTVPHRTHLFGLPGNPLSALVGWILIVAPAIRALQGDDRPHAPRLMAQLTEAVTRKAGRREFLPVTLSVAEDGVLLATPVAARASGSVPATAYADAWLDIPSERAQLAAGERVRVIRWADV
jgi:molybdopterin molybdotransferase